MKDVVYYLRLVQILMDTRLNFRYSFYVMRCIALPWCTPLGFGQDHSQLLERWNGRTGPRLNMPTMATGVSSIRSEP